MVLTWWLILSLPILHVQTLITVQKTPKNMDPLNLEVNATVEYVLIYKGLKELNTTNPFRIKTSINSSTEFPVMISTRHSKSVASWTVPLLIETRKDEARFFNPVSKIMCRDPTENEDHSNSSFLPQNFIITLSTFSNNTINITVELEELKDFYIELDKSYSLVVSPSEAKYVFFSFDENTLDTVIINIESKDEVCFTASVQNSKCPVHDMNKDIQYDGRYQTINTIGSITISKGDYTDGFFLVFVAKPVNSDCHLKSSHLPNAFNNITTQIDFKIRNGIAYRQYAIAIAGTISVLIFTGILLLITTCLFHNYGTVSTIFFEDDIVRNHPPEPEPNDDEQAPLLNRAQHPGQPVVADFSKNPRQINKRSFDYFLQTLNVALFYSIPVVQLVIYYQKIVNVTGDQDMCYFNYKCALPAKGFSDFNHIFSNLGYVAFGIIYIIIVRCRQRSIGVQEETGIPAHYGILYACGLALIIEGVFSACYHVCPSQSNFQFGKSSMIIYTGHMIIL